MRGRPSTSPRRRPTWTWPSGWFDQFEGAGLDGVVAKPLDGHLPAGQAGHVQDQARAHRRLRGRRLPGAQERRRTRSARCCSACTTTTATLASVGVIGAFPMARRKELFAELQPLVTTFDDHPWDWAAQEDRRRARRASPRARWNAGKDLSFVPLRPERVVEVRYEHMEGVRFRHTAQFNRWRPDRDPRVVHLRAARGAGPVRPRRHSELLARSDPREQAAGGRPPVRESCVRGTSRSRFVGRPGRGTPRRRPPRRRTGPPGRAARTGSRPPGAGAEALQRGQAGVGRRPPRRPPPPGQRGRPARRDREQQVVEPDDLGPVGRRVARRAVMLRGDRGLQLVRVGDAVGAAQATRRAAGSPSAIAGRVPAACGPARPAATSSPVARRSGPAGGPRSAGAGPGRPSASARRAAGRAPAGRGGPLPRSASTSTSVAAARRRVPGGVQRVHARRRRAAQPLAAARRRTGTRYGMRAAAILCRARVSRLRHRGLGAEQHRRDLAAREVAQGAQGQGHPRRRARGWGGSR